MPGTILHMNAQVVCPHGGQGKPTALNPKVLISGQAIANSLAPYSVAGCTLSSDKGGPCVTAQWVYAATKVFSYGAPVLLLDSQAICEPTKAPLKALVAAPSTVFGM